MVAGKPVSVQSPASTRLRQAVAAPGRFKSCAGVAAKVARRSRTICHGGKRSARRQPGHACDLRPDRLGQFLARRIDQAVAGADGHRYPARENENPFHRAIDDAEDRRLAGRRIDPEMRVDDGAKLVRRAQAPRTSEAAV